ncbi:neurobeachin isoform X4 [Petromyzon marinus]|uniref:neurobeachin isoform X4 n=1 Tax=Petromyzon marinus TaxID=7757 RepID=UPI003F723A7E
MEVDGAGDAAVIAHTAAADATAAVAAVVTAAVVTAAPADGGEGGGGCVGGDEFAALREKVLAGQTSSREVVDTVLNLLVGGQFDLEANFVVRDPEGVSGLVCLLDVCDPQCRGEILSLFTAVLRKSLRNLQACTEAGLIGQLLQRLQKLDDVTAELLVGVVGVLASYSITVRELKLLFGCLRGEKSRWRRHAVKLLSVLNHMPQRHGPETFFSFPGGSGSAIALPPIARWPYQNGFTVHMWVRMDPVTSLNAEKEKPYLYCFRTSKGVGYSSHFMGSCLTVTALKSKGKGSQHCIQYDFQPKKWYMITIVHVYNRWKNCEIRCYVDGNLVSSGDMAWYISTNDTFDKCYLGSADNIDADRTFSGQMSAVYLFSEALNGSQVAAIFQLGPGYKNTFKFETESDLHLPEHHQFVLYEGRLAGYLAFTYNAKATDGQLCLESSPRDTTSIFVHTPHALMLQCVKAVVTNPIHSAMHSIGGVQVLFPLFGQLDYLEHNSEEMNTSVCGTLLAFLLDLLKSSVIMQEQMVSSKGFLLIGAHLEKASTQHLTLSVVGHLLGFTKYLESIPNGAPLLKQLCDYILFNPAIWVHVDANVQQTLYTYLANEFVKKTRIFNAVRRIGTAIQVLHTLKHYYWLVNPMDRSGTVPRGLGEKSSLSSSSAMINPLLDQGLPKSSLSRLSLRYGPRPSRDDMASLRAYLLLFLKQLILKEGGLKPDELQSILNYLLTVHEDDNLYDVLQLLVALMSESPSSVIPAFDQRSGIRVAFKLLASRSEHIRVQALKVLSYFLKHLSSKRKAELMVAPSLFSLLGERLMLHTNVLSMTTYNVLFEMLTENVCTQVIHKQHPDADSSVKIQNPLILKVVATLLRSAPATIETMEVKRVFLSDMIRLFNNNRENRRSLLQCSVWQEWMFSLAYFSPRSTEERKITEMVFTLFRILLYHAVKYEWGGWRVWVDTLSIAHFKVSFEAHKERLAQMYADFQRREQENGGRAEAAAGTVSTVSGLSDGAGLAKITELPGEDAADPYEGFPLSSQGADKAKRGSLLREVAQMGQAAAPPLEGGPPHSSADDAGTMAQDAAEAEGTEEGGAELDEGENKAEEGETKVETVEAETEEEDTAKAEGEVKAKAEDAEATAAEGETEIEGEHKVKEQETEVDEEEITAEAETTAEEEVSIMETEEEVEVEVEAKAEEGNEDGDSQEGASEEAETSEGGDVQREDEDSAETAAMEGAKRTEGAEAAAPGDHDDGPAGDAAIGGGEEEAAEGKAAIVQSATPTNEASGGGMVDDDEQTSEVSKEASVSFTDASADGEREFAQAAELLVGEVCRTAVSVISSEAAEKRGDGEPRASDQTDCAAAAADRPSECQQPSAGDDGAKDDGAGDGGGGTEEKSKAEKPRGDDDDGGGAVTAQTSTLSPRSEATAELNAKTLVEQAMERDVNIQMAKTAQSAPTPQQEGQPGVVLNFRPSTPPISTTASTTASAAAAAAAAAAADDAREKTAGAQQGGAARRDGLMNAGTQAATFRIPDFQWSGVHQRLLADILFALESDIHIWRSHTTKLLMDFVNSSENYVFVHNMLQITSHLVDNLIMVGGGLLPMLQAVTSPPDVDLGASQHVDSLPSEIALNFLHRLLNLVDALVFASSLNFSEVESEKNMKAGGLLRQCLRLVCCVALRNCVESQEQQRSRAESGSESSTSSTAKGAAEPPPTVPARDPERLLQPMDVHRLRAVVFRDVEDTKQAQFLGLAVVYFISVLMVSKYRDILESGHGGRMRSLSTASQGGGAKPVEAKPAATGSVRRDNNAAERAAPEPAGAASSVDGSPSAGPDAMSELLSTLSTEVKRSDEVASVAAISMVEIPLDSTPMPSPVNGGKPFPPASHDAPATAAVASPLAHGAEADSSSRKPEVVAAEAAEIKGEVGASGKEESGKASELSSAPAPAPKDSAVGSTAGDKSQEAGSSGGAMVQALPDGKASVPAPRDGNNITQRLERALESTAPLLREIFVDFSPYLSRTLLGSHGQELLLQGSGLASIKSSTSVVELVMLLCSQEWQNSIQKHAGLAFIELVNEGRILCHAMKEHLVRVGSEADFILERQHADEINKHAEFESHCAQYSADRREEEKLCHHMIGAARRRDGVMATRLHHRIVDILSKRHGAWGHVLQSRAREFWRLDSWEDDQRRRRRLVPNRQGSTHAEATLRPALETVSDEEVARRASRALRERMTDEELRSPETPSEGDAVDLSVDVEDEASGRSSPERGDWDLDTLTGPVALSTPAQLITPTVAFRGTLSITANELCFEVDEDDPGFKAVDPKVLAYTESLHGKWLFSEVEAIFSRRYLLQNTALEIFLSSRTSIMFNLPDATIVKSVVHLLPRVGIGTLYGLPQARRYSLASPRQLFKASNMTQRWQQRDVSNFEYLMFLNTIAGRTYNDLNQYPVFPWVIANYDSEELDLTLPSNFRDLSKPVGALNPQRAAVFAERYASWDDADIPAFHYGTHYSTAAFVLMWLLRVEPFTNYFLSLQGGKFDHADRTFSSVARAWRNSQRDTSDVKELIPEFFYLPEMFTNSNDYNLGVTDAGVAVGDVVLPPWAKTGEEFVRINRAALESEIVSCQLHQWVDLIFGYKQRGPEAIRAMNVYYYLTYEGAVNMASIRDRVTREAVEAQIRSFGQTPAQLMVEPHAPRSSAMHMTPMMFSNKSQQEVIMVLKFPSNSPVTHVAANTGPMQSPPAILTITCSRLFAINKWNGLCGSLERSSASMEDIMRLPVEIDPLLVANMGLHRRQIMDPVDHSVPTCVNTFTVTADNRFVMLGGFWDKSFRVYSTDTGRLKQAMFGHWDVVTCLARSEVGVGGDCYVASGSRDATVLLWRWSGRELALGDRTMHGNMRSPRAILTGHDTEVTSVAVSTELGLAISGSIGSPCLMHTLAGELLRALEGAGATATPLLLAISQDALCFGYYDDGTLLSFSVNGRLSARTPTGDTTRAMVLSADGQYVLTGGDKGVVEVWRAYDLAKLYTYPMCDSSVRALGLSYDQRVVIAGMATGSIVLFHINFNHWHCEYQERYSAP